MKKFEHRFSWGTQWIQNNGYYLGLIFVSFLVYQARRTSQVSERIVFIFYLGFMVWSSIKKARTEALLKQSERMNQAAEKASQAKSIFLAHMSHEIRTPMHGIMSFAKFGQKKIGVVSNEKIKSYFNEIYDSGARLMSLLNDLLDLSKLEAGKFIYVMKDNDLMEIVVTVSSEIQAFVEEKGLKLETVSQTSKIVGFFDSERIMQVMRNLLSNAIKFSEKGTTIQIRLTQSVTSISCQVLNQGVFIPQSELESIFNKFVQSSQTRLGAGGTGLGLAICKDIIQQQHGKIWAESKLSGETKFIFELPRAAIKADSSEEVKV